MPLPHAVGGRLNPVLTVVLPCHNEAGNIARYDRDLFPALDALGAAYEVVIVDDGSLDDTSSKAAELLMTRKDVRLVKLAPNRGMGGAIRAGMSEARGEWIATLDADLTFPPAALKDMLAAGIAAKADLVSGSPYLRPGDMAGVSWVRALPSLMINALYRGLFGMRLTAYTPVLRLYRTAFIRDLDIVSNGFEINAEIAARAMIDRRVVAEVPAPLRARTAGVSKLQRGRELRRHLSLILRLLSGR
ncbi:MAG: glycosyltransferase family 2 protein [Elusimicrobia bacterium]|nr:glycosyltransferase family 2 protein [Elusimicrobiota bacterium]